MLFLCGMTLVPTAIVGLIALILMQKVLRRTICRDHEIGEITTLTVYPPKYSLLTTAKLMTAYERPVDDVMAAWLLDLAVRRYLRICQRSEAHAGRVAGYELEILQTIDKLHEEEREVLTGIFDRQELPVGERLPLELLRNKAGCRKHFSSDQSKMEIMMRGQLGLTEQRPEHRRLFGWYMWVLGVLGLLTLSLPLVVAATQAWYERRRYSLSDKGLALRRHMLELQRAIASPGDAWAAMLVEAEKQPENPDDPGRVVEVSERLLPYAVLYGTAPTEAWASMLENCYIRLQRPPEWFSKDAFVSPGGFVAAMLDFPWTIRAHMAVPGTRWAVS